ncbi:cytochrome P450 alkane hydroxylase-like protein [Podospora didyma]|uniref:Cytochrome P450 alkane hydroxylase-like protein n=1 Tax=Podospora didyma TaxID=330526 RepID=A0AAE0JWV9_9PEZI|nr:cytochrome P450 alkane hydroxylase-like protein [Podospora didyma]KAK3392762.1 cytochrome P450 alkane hydroxylase-like protein [Podospora didyma]
MLFNIGLASLYLAYLVAFSTAVHGAVAYFRNRKFSKANGCEKPRNVAHTREPIIGLDFLLECLRNAKSGHYIRYCASRLFRYGFTYITRRATFDTIHTADPENLKFMLATGFDNYKLARLRVNAMAPLFGSGIFTTNGPAWAHSRAILRPSFTRQNMAPLLAMMERHFQMLLRQVPKDGSTPFDVQRLFFCFTMDTATEFLMGRSTNTLDPSRHTEADRVFVQDYLDCCFEAVRMIASGPLQAFRVSSRSLRVSRDRAWAYVDRFVDDALAKREARRLNPNKEMMDTVDKEDYEKGAEYNFLEELAAQTTNKTLLRDQVLNVLLASRDTTAALLSNMFYELARHPEIFAKLREEALSKIKGELPTEAELNNMPYLRWCINESLRMYPVVPGNTREAVRDTILPVGGGEDGRSPIFVKKGTPVLYNLYAMHRRPDIYGEDVDEYRPERWDGLRPGWGFLPFNGGPRICLGQQFALTEASYVTARMLQSFETLVPRDAEPWVEFYSLVMCSKHGVRVSIKPVKSVAAM